MSSITLKSITKEYTKNMPVIKNLNIEIKDKSFTVLLGPSGCGKSTILRMIAGLEKQTNGSILFDDNDMTNVEPEDRDISFVFQNYALYPTMTVRDNIEFGLKNRKISKDEIEKRVEEVCKILNIFEFLDRKPQNLSGGQRQRVALARAIVKKPKVFLMDEPLSNLDAKLRNQIRIDLIELHKKLNVTFVYVTHDQVEAMSMATEIILLEKGNVMQQCSPVEIYRKPQNIFSATFIGTPCMNILPSKILNGNAANSVAHVGFRPEHVVFENTSNNNCIAINGEIVQTEMLGPEMVIKLKTDFGHIFARQYGDYETQNGTLSCYVKKEHLNFFNNAECRVTNE